MELLVHVSTSGHLLVACMQVVVAVALIEVFDVHVIMGTPTPHLLLWAMTIFVRVLQQSIPGVSEASIRTIFSGTPWEISELTL